MKLAHALNECADLERRIAELYGQFAALWRDDPALAALWGRMADEERDHAAALEALAERIGGGHRRPLDREALAQLRGYVRGTGGIVGDISLDEAFRIALELETLELHDIYHRLIGYESDPSLPEGALADCLAALGPHEAPLFETIERLTRSPELRERVRKMRQQPFPAGTRHEEES